MQKNTIASQLDLSADNRKTFNPRRFHLEAPLKKTDVVKKQR